MVMKAWTRALLADTERDRRPSALGILTWIPLRGQRGEQVAKGGTKKIKELSVRVHLHSKIRKEKKRSTEAKCCEGEKTKKKGKDCPHIVQQLEKPLYYK